MSANNKMNCGLLCLMLLTAFPYILSAQAPEGAAAKPDSAQVKADVEKGKKDGGTMWANKAHFFCEAPHGNRPDDPLIEPTKIFDNVYAIGRAGTTVYAITTSAGIILIDSGYQNEVEQVLVAGLKKLNLDPAQVKMIVLGHGHVDHFGGAPYFQDHYGTHVYLTAADWDFMEHPPAARGGAKAAPKGPPATQPKHDMVITEGQAFVLGEEKIMPFYIPGHTPGSVALIFAVKDNGKTHMAGLYGGHFGRRITAVPAFDRTLQGRDKKSEGRCGTPESYALRQRGREARQTKRAEKRRSQSVRRRPSELPEVPRRDVGLHASQHRSA